MVEKCFLYDGCSHKTGWCLVTQPSSEECPVYCWFKQRMKYGANEYIYCAVDENDQIVWVKGSSSKTRYFKTRHYLDKAVEYHNKCNPDDPWRIARFALIEEVS